MGSPDPRTAEAARRLVDQALLLRRNAVVALFRIYVALAWPNAGLAAAPILEGYRDLSGAAMLLGRLQNPATRFASPPARWSNVALLDSRHCRPVFVPSASSIICSRTAHVQPPLDRVTCERPLLDS